MPMIQLDKMPMTQPDKETNEPVTYYTEAEVRAIIDEIVDGAEDWAGEDLRVVSNRILFEHGFEVKNES